MSLRLTLSFFLLVVLMPLILFCSLLLILVVFWQLFFHMGNSFVKDLVLTFILTDSGDLSQSKEYLKAIKVSWRPLCTMILILSFGVGDMHNYPLSATPPKWSNTLKQFVSFCRQIV